MKMKDKNLELDKLRKELNDKPISNDNLMLSIDNKTLTIKNGN